MFPEKYKLLLSILQDGQQFDLLKLDAYFTDIQNEIENNRHLKLCVTDFETKTMSHKAARSIVEKSIKHYGSIEIDKDFHDSIDDCADILIDLDEIRQLELNNKPDDAWFQYILLYDAHFGEHIDRLRLQINKIKSTHQ